MSYIDILREKFSLHDQDSAIKIVDSYDGLECDRVKEAISRLSSGSLDGLQHYLEAAKNDYRDVLYWAENTDEAKDSSVSALSGMTVNERLYHTGLLDAFDSAVKANDFEAIRKILESCFLGKENIDAIIKNCNNT